MDDKLEKKDEKPLILETIDIDLNKLFSLTYTFDNLKSFMSSLSKNQSLMSDKINELEDKLKQQIDINKNYETLIKSLESNIKKVNKKEKKIKLDSKNKDKDIIKGENKEGTQKNEDEDFHKKEEDKNKEENIINIEEKDKGKINNIKEEQKKNEKERKLSFNLSEKNLRKISISSKEMESENNYENLNEILKENNQQLIDIKNRLTDMESKTKEYDLFISNQKNNNPNKEEIDLIKNQIKSILNKTEEMRIQKDDLKKKVEDISVKIIDFNIIDILKNSSIKNGAQVEPDKLLVLNLEQKFQKKTSILDEKFKKHEEELNKIKNNFDNIKNNFEVIEQNFSGTKNNIKDIREEIMKSNLDYRNLVTEINDKLNLSFNQKLETQKKEFNKSIDKIRQQIKNIKEKGTILEDLNDMEKFGKGLSDNDLLYITELSKKLSDIEKQIPLIYKNIELIRSKDKEDIAKVENELLQKINTKEFFELNDKVNLQNTISNNIREMVERVQDLTNKNMKDLNFFLRKIESLSGSVISMQNVLETLTGMKQDNSVETTNYLELESFNEFIKMYNKDKKFFERNIDEFRRIFTDFSEVIKSKASDEDLKNFESIVINKIEEIKINCGKKFADKIDTNKSLKYLDAQIRYMSEIFMKKGEKNDNWLLAKKPVGGFSCASCESYIGELKDKGDYVTWNKYPQRNIEKNYRVGNGFSRMLNMFNIDVKNSLADLNMNTYESDDDSNQNQHIHQTNNTINFNISQGAKNSSSNKSGFSLKRSFNNAYPKNHKLPRLNSFDSIPNIIKSENIVENISNNKTIGLSGKTFHDNDENKNNESTDNKPHIVKVFRKNK